jgi:predicted Zn-dependent peptidase
MLVPLLLISALLASRADAPAVDRLPNGVGIVVRERKSSPLVAIDLWMKAGARYEAPGEEGCAHFLEHTLFKGTQTRTAGQVDLDMESLGASLEAATGPDFTHFYTTVTSSNVEGALRIIADVVRNATLPETEVEKERGVILDELSQRESDPRERAVDLLYATAFNKHPYHRSPGGQPSDFSRLRSFNLTGFYRRTYAPERCVIAFAGAITASEAHSDVVQTFGDWQSSTVFPSASDEPQEQPAAGGLQRGPSGDPHRACVGFAFPVAPAGDAEGSAFARLAAVLLGSSDGMGRLNTPLLRNLHASAFYRPRVDASLLYVTVDCRPQDLERVETELRGVVGSLASNPPSATEIATAVQTLIGRDVYDCETDAGMARAIGYAAITGSESLQAEHARLRALSAAQFRSYLATTLAIDRAIIVRLVPPDAE